MLSFRVGRFIERTLESFILVVNRGVITLYPPKQMNLNETPPRTFNDVRDIMEAPWSDAEIEELMMQPPLNQAAFLPAEEQPEENQCQS